MERLHEVTFEYIHDMDENRYVDGTSLRYHFACDIGQGDNSAVVKEVLAGPCTILEMMVALCDRMEESIMTSTYYGNRTGQWFKNMIKSLGLENQTNDHFDREYVNLQLTNFLDREYEPDGKGGLFTVPDCDEDMRELEIWVQMNWYIESIT